MSSSSAEEGAISAVMKSDYTPMHLEYQHRTMSLSDFVLFYSSQGPGAALTSSTGSTLKCCLLWRSKSSPSYRHLATRPSASSLREGRSASAKPVASSSP